MLEGNCKDNWVALGLVVDYDFKVFIRNFLIDKKNLIIFRYISLVFK